MTKDQMKTELEKLIEDYDISRILYEDILAQQLKLDKSAQQLKSRYLNAHAKYAAYMAARIEELQNVKVS